MAKIHTVDWTPAIIAHPTSVRGLRANWWGLEGERLVKRIGRITSNQVIRGIPGSPTNHHGVPYSLTEEFVAVYRMHPLIPDDFSFRSLGNDTLYRSARSRSSACCTCGSGSGEMSMTDVLYSFGTSHPGAITLHNYPPLPPGLPPRRTGRTSIWPRSTSCACASAGCRATTSSGGCST